MNQSLRHITFIFGPPESVSENNRYAELLEISKESSKTFSEVYKNFLKHSIQDNKVLEMVFKEVIEKEILFNEYFFGEMMTAENNDQNKKFFTQNNESINIPTLTIYPPKITYKNGSLIDFDFNNEYAEITLGLLGTILRLDWIRHTSA
tara:strand:+ start:94 stop:540 length:447 start_codon:yes stop_codon:yes gene_type:complete